VVTKIQPARDVFSGTDLKGTTAEALRGAGSWFRRRRDPYIEVSMDPIADPATRAR